MAKKSTVSQIVKKTAGVKKVTTEPSVNKVQVETLPEENSKIKETASKLIEHVDLLTASVLSNKHPEESKAEVVAETVVEQKHGDLTMEWYEEQLKIMYVKYDELVEEKNRLLDIINGNAVIENNYSGDPENDEIKKNVLRLFMEIQENHFSWGRNFKIIPPRFMDRLITLFPFLQQYKRYND